MAEVGENSDKAFRAFVGVIQFDGSRGMWHHCIFTRLGGRASNLYASVALSVKCTVNMRGEQYEQNNGTHQSTLQITIYLFGRLLQKHVEVWRRARSPSVGYQCYIYSAQ